MINIIPGGPDLFSSDGKTWAFPFGHTAGTDRSTNIQVVNLLSLPKKSSDSVHPIVYWVDRRSTDGLPIIEWRWLFPAGTTFGELIYIKNGSDLYLTELRTRTRYPDGWAVNTYRPFPTAQHLVAAIKSKRPNWQSDSSLNNLVLHLENPNTLTARTLKTRDVLNQAFQNTFNQSGYIDVLPEFGDTELVKDLLRNSTFISAYGTSWKQNGEQKAFAASSNSSFSIVPNQYEAGVIEVNEKSCHRCHKDANHPVRHFNPSAVLYGNVWGVDQIFSFHLWDQSLIRGSADDNRSVDPRLSEAGVIVRKSPEHTAPMYKELASEFTR